MMFYFGKYFVSKTPTKRSGTSPEPNRLIDFVILFAIGFGIGIYFF